MHRLSRTLRRWLDPRPRTRRPVASRDRLRIEPLEPRALLSLTLLRDVNPGSASPGEFATVGSVAYFVTEDSATATLWSSDGTVAGTSPVAAFSTAAEPQATPRHLTSAGGTLYFTALDSKDRPTLNRLRSGVVEPVFTDADGLGGEAIANLRASATSLFFTTDFGRDLSALDLSTGAVATLGRFATIDDGARVVGDRLYFVAESAAGPETGRELWTSDGTASGTHMVADLAPGASGSDPGTIAGLGGTAYFSAAVAGASGVYRVEAGATSVTRLFAVPSPPTELVASGGWLYLVTSGPATGTELYRSDGSVAPPSLVVDLAPGAASSAVRNLTDGDGRLFFTDDRDGSTRLYVTEGTTATTLVLGAIPLADAPSPDGRRDLTPAGGRVFFRGYDATSGVELWASDGTVAGTGATADLLPGPRGTGPSRFTRLGSQVLFAGTDANGAFLGVSDGTAPGTRMLRNFGALPTADSIEPNGLADDDVRGVTAGGLTFFVASDPDHGAELWRTDGTGAGTGLAVDLAPGPRGSAPRGLTTFGGAVYFVADDPSGGTGLYRYDPATSATVAVFLDPTRRVASRPAVVGDRLAFLTDDGTAGLWRSGGTAETTALVSDFGGTLFLTAPELESTGERVYFRAFDGNRGEEMWRSDLTPEGTGLIIDLVPGPEGSAPRSLTAVGPLVYFVANDADGLAALWRTDGSAGSTYRLSPLVPRLAFAESRRLPVIGNFLLFIADDGASGPSLWRHDLTTGAVGPVGGPGVEPTDLFVLGDRLMFSGRDLDDRPAIFATDGTAVGTFALVTGAGLLGPIFASGGTAYFATDDPTSGAFFGTDGTPGGTAVASALTASWRGRRILPLGPAPGGGYVVAADDGFHGLEPALFLPSTGAANQPPVIAPIPEQRVVAGEILSFVAQASDPDEGQSVRFSLSAPDLIGATIDPVTGAFRYAPAEDVSGTFTATIQVVDDAPSPRSATLSFVVRVAAINRAPALDPIDDREVAAGDELVVTASASDPDPGQTLRFGVTAPDLPGAAIDPTTGVFRYTPSLATSGLFSVTLTVTDDGDPAKSAERQFLVLVTPFNHAPTLDPLADAAAIAGTPWEFSAYASDLDADQTLTFAISAPAGLRAAIGARDGRGSILADEGVTGTFAVTVSVTDDASRPKTASRTFSVTVSAPPPGNAPPVLEAVPDQAVIQLDTLSVRVVASDPDPGQSLTYRLGVDAPAGAAIDATGLLTWTPGLDQPPGDVAFSVIATDDAPTPLSATRTVLVRVGRYNSPPTLGPIADRTIDEGGTLSFTPTSGDVDADQSLTFTSNIGVIDPTTGLFTFVAGDDAEAPIPVTITVRDDGSPSRSTSRSFAIRVRNVAPVVTIGADLDLVAPGTFTRVGSFADPGPDAWTATVDYGDGLGPRPLTLNPDRTFALNTTYAVGGAYVVTVRVDDGDGGVGIASLRVRANSRPAIDPIADRVVPEGSTLVLSPVVRDPDPGQALSYSATGGTIDASGTFRFVAADDGAPIDASITVRDDGSPSLFATRTFRITVSNVAPIAAIDGGPSTLDDGLFERGGGFFDPGADAWTATVDYGDGTGGPLALGPDRRFTLGHRYAAAGRYAVVVRVDDGDGGVGTATLDVVVPAAPAPAPVATIGVGVMAGEVDRSAGVAVFVVARSGGLAAGMSVRFETVAGSATAGVDYDATSGVIVFEAGETSRTILIPLRADGPGGGRFRLVLSAPAGGASLGPVSDAEVAIRPVMAPTSPPAPTPAIVTSASFVTKGKKGPATIVVRFAGGLDPSTAGNPASYAVFVSVRRGKKLVAKSQPIRSAVYDDATGTVTLTPARRAFPKGTPMLRLASGAIRDRAGQALDGDRDGRPGGDALLTLGRIVSSRAIADRRDGPQPR